ncbi:hypothetical protein PR048_001122 [Dryococelus australis]|uniref:Uncharacterized protein n=1 Tax=Dryococelus australis TaxID=614101 RepID=A0ABQ9IGL1_9NEOP|nr:hypothetical protein PR048_001122 [Dryococelus australis]
MDKSEYVSTLQLSTQVPKQSVQSYQSFLKLDTNSGYWQVLLAEESKPLTMLITQFGRFYFN